MNITHKAVQHCDKRGRLTDVMTSLHVLGADSHILHQRNLPYDDL